MRIVAIGLGGAGCRIVDSLYAIDRRGSRIACVQALAIDVDATTLQQLAGIPDSLKIYFPPFDPENPDHSGANGPTATIDIAEILSRISNFESGETDAILICCGSGGRMADIVPHVITGLRFSIVEPIFGLVTLPCLAEGEKRSVKAADDIDILMPLLDGLILFDNETWYKKTKARHAKQVKKEKGLAQMLGFGKAEPELSPELATYHLLNEAIVRRISLILKAGEFRADGGIDLAEVVLDSGEVLNTIKGGGFITIGYAVEKLSASPLAFLSQLKPAGLFNEESKKRASRIVELTKQAIYHEVSTPCDMTSAHKALVLIAGPSHELSMQGFMTVRKWIDRSIRGLEMRSGDYPVMNTKNVAIIVMLSGLENIPRINELREIREQARLGPVRGAVSDDEGITTPRLQQDTGSLRDEMIVLPIKMQKGLGSPRHPEDDTSRAARSPVRESEAGMVHPAHKPESQPWHTVPAPGTFSRHPPQEETPARTARDTEEKIPETLVSPGIPHHRRIVGNDHDMQEKRQPAQQPISRESPADTGPHLKTATDINSKETARQRIEQELQRQRMLAFSGSPTESADRVATSRQAPSEIIRPKRVITHESPQSQTVARHPEPEQDMPQATGKTVIIRKRTPVTEVTGTQIPEKPAESPATIEETGAAGLFSQKDLHIPEPEEEPVTVKDPLFRAKDGIFTGKSVRRTAVPKVRDTSLLHTNLKPKKPVEQADNNGERDNTPDNEAESSPEQHQDKKMKKRDDISWI